MKLITWWQQRDPREHIVMMSAGVFLFILAIYLMLEPVMLERERMQQAIPALRADLSWMQQHAVEVRTLLNQTNQAEAIDHESISLSGIQSIINAMSLEDRLAELGPGVGQGIRIQFNEIMFADLVKFMYRLKENSGSNIRSARITRQGDGQGTVQALIVLGR